MVPMLSDEQKRRIEQLNRQRLRFKLTPASDLQSRQGESARAEKLPLEQAVPGEQVRLDPTGTCWVVRRPVRAVWSGAGQVLAEYQRAVCDGLAAAPDALTAELQQVLAAGPGGALFMDLETCGLGGTPLFLIGVMYFADGDLQLEQIFARDYSEEAAALQIFWRRLSWHPVLVTFNGKTFDWPKVVERSVVGRVRPGAEPVHCDLLHEARRRWRHWLPNCRLQTLELMLCKRGRKDDIPSAAIGDAYHRFVRKGDARMIKKIFHHNALDLITMADLLTRMLRGHDGAP
jgi:hypothetical protein